jgi:hypothetical protein
MHTIYYLRETGIAKPLSSKTLFIDLVAKVQKQVQGNKKTIHLSRSKTVTWSMET